MFSLLIGPLTTLIERLFPDKAQQDAAKAEMMSIVAKAQAEEYKAKGAIITAEAKGESWMQRNWRPLLMMVFIVLIVNNYLVAPYLSSIFPTFKVLELPSEMWTLLTVGIGGYIGGRSAEKVYKSINERKFYESLRQDFGPLSQEQVEAFNKALENSK